MADAWTVRLDNRVRPIIERIAACEDREPAQVVRRLLDSVLERHPVAARYSQQDSDGAS